jgi:hypothetical protein
MAQKSHKDEDKAGKAQGSLVWESLPSIRVQDPQSPNTHCSVSSNDGKKQMMLAPNGKKQRDIKISVILAGA